MTLGLSVPLYDEEALVEAVVTELIGALEAGDVPFRLALVDNGSRDRTGEIVDRLAAEFWLGSRRFRSGGTVGCSAGAGATVRWIRP